MKKYLNLITAFIVMLVVFFTVSVFTLGTTKHTGKSTHYEAGTTIYYDIAVASTDAVDAVYINIGAIHAPVDEEVSITVKYSKYSTGTSFSRFGEVVKIHNLTQNQNYNWICVAKDQAKKGLSRLSFSADSALELGEIVCYNASGKLLKLTMSPSTKDYATAEVNKSLDAQENFATGVSSYYNFNNDEATMLASLDNVRRGNDYATDGVYTLASEYNYLANLIIIPSVAMFGASPFALRFPSLIATTVMLIVAFLFFKQLLKNQKTAFIATLFSCVVGGFVARTGGAYACVACALLLSAYFGYKFFAKGIRSKAVVKGSLNIFYSGLFSALALAMDSAAIFPIIGVGAILAFGWRRQKLAYQIELASGKDDERKVKADYERKNRISACFAIISFFAVYFITMIVSTVICYPAIARSYSADIGFGSAMWKGISQSFIGGNALSTTGVGSIFAWFLAVTSLKTSLWYFFFSVAGFISLATLVTVVVRAYIQKQNGKDDLRLRRIAITLIGGMLCCLVAGLVKPSSSTAYFTLFGIFYGAIIAVAIGLGTIYLINKRKDR